MVFYQPKITLQRKKHYRSQRNGVPIPVVCHAAKSDRIKRRGCTRGFCKARNQEKNEEDVGLASSIVSSLFRILNQVDGDHQIHCSRERSRTAWKIIQEYLMPFVEKEKYHIPKRCRFHPDNDIYRDQEQHKFHIDINEWQCGAKLNSSTAYRCYEKILLVKLCIMHVSALSNQCLADVCGALHCDHEVNSGSKKSKCNPAAAARNKHLCEPTVAFQLMRVLWQADFMNCFCTNSVSHTAALEVGNLSQEGAGGMKRETQVLKRISQTGRKKKPS
ncbi:hypothetical protein V8G54_031832 [Vigna mungo]|uniref:Uncharacterized protein n=1 Tax=Vigna mungo TaxID=3915 RepID=A0AAQ3MLT9_VIGMU